LLNGLIQPFQQPERVIGFFNSYRQQYPVSRDVLHEVATQAAEKYFVARRTQAETPLPRLPLSQPEALTPLNTQRLSCSIESHRFDKSNTSRST
jgi:hypothetical protein